MHDSYVYQNFDLPKVQNINNLTFIEKVFLSSLNPQINNDEYALICPKNFETLTPSQEYTQQILFELLQNQILNIAPDNTTKELLQMNYIINIPFEQHFLLKNILCLNTTEIIYEQMDIIELWEEIASYEIIEYLESWILPKFNITVLTEKKALINKFKHLLQYYSQGQIYSIIYSSAKYAQTLIDKEPFLDTENIRNIIIGCTFKHANNALKNDWFVSTFNKPYSIDQSQLSNHFFNKILKAKDYTQITIKQFFTQKYSQIERYG